MRKKRLFLLAVLALAASASLSGQRLMNQAPDLSRDFVDMTSIYFFAEKLSDFNTATGEGKVQWGRYSLEPRQAFNTNTVVMDKLRMKDFPSSGYENDPQFYFKVDFISDRTVRVRMLTSLVQPKEVEEVMFSPEFIASDPHVTWACTETENEIVYTSPEGSSLTIVKQPWRLVLKDASGKVLTQTWTSHDNDVSQVKTIPFGFRKGGIDNARRITPVFSLKAGERIYVCGESPTGLNKVGQKVNLFVTDPQGPETDEMYKPVPFYFSNRGYGVFMHTSAPVTCDFGASYVGATKLFMADENFDFFFFVGSPAEILDAYTDVVGKTPMPPTWSFGTWMSRITYLTQADGYEIASKLRENRIPADVIHFDTGWFGVDWQCDYKFAEDRFSNPQKMIKDLLDDGFHISLWQLTYFTQHNTFYNELIDKNLVVRNADGTMPYEDAVLDFTNPETVKWYQGHLRELLEMGVGAIKADFGEGAPLDGFYSNGRGGLYEHNLYPVRYNKAVWEVTKDVQKPDGAVIWARSAWAGSQRYPLHWGGDAANTNEAMLSTLHAGMSFGLSGFPFWSHDIGGFVKSTPEDLYRRWLPFGFLSSHTRSHGEPPTEPWLYNQEFTDYYRASAEMKYKLMPYVLEQAKKCTETGLPMVRAMFIEYPDDPVAWMVEDQYLFGSDILVAPIFDTPQDYNVQPRTARNAERPTTGLRHWTRKVYLPGGQWVDYQTGKVYKPGWNDITTADLEAVILVRKGAVIPTVPVAQSTKDIDWNAVKNVKY